MPQDSSDAQYLDFAWVTALFATTPAIPGSEKDHVLGISGIDVVR